MKPIHTIILIMVLAVLASIVAYLTKEPTPITELKERNWNTAAVHAQQYLIPQGALILDIVPHGNREIIANDRKYVIFKFREQCFMLMHTGKSRGIVNYVCPTGDNR